MNAAEVNAVLSAAAPAGVTLDLITSDDISTAGYLEANVDKYALVGVIGAAVTMTAAQAKNISAAAGLDSVTIKSADLSTIDVIAAVEAYTIGDDTVGDAVTVAGVTGAQNVTASSATDAVTVKVSGAYTGALSGDATKADTVSLAAGADISKATIGAAFENLTLAAGSVTMTIAQLAAFTGTVTGTGVNTVVFSDDGAVTAVVGIENYALASGASASTITLSDGGQSVTAGKAGDEVITDVADVMTGTFTGSVANTLTITADDGDDFTGATLVAVKALEFESAGGTVTIDEGNLIGLSGIATAITGGAGTDVLALEKTGDGTFNFTSVALTAVEEIEFASNDIKATFNVADLTGVTDIRMSTGSSLTIVGTAGDDTITVTGILNAVDTTTPVGVVAVSSGLGADTIVIGTPAIGGPGLTLDYSALDSNITDMDTVKNFRADFDRVSFAAADEFSFQVIATADTATLAGAFDNAISAARAANVENWNSAGDVLLVTIAAGTAAGTYALVNDGNNATLSSADLVLMFDSPLGTLTSANFIA